MAFRTLPELSTTGDGRSIRSICSRRSRSICSRRSRLKLWDGEILVFGSSQNDTVDFGEYFVRLDHRSRETPNLSRMFGENTFEWGPTNISVNAYVTYVYGTLWSSDCFASFFAILYPDCSQQTRGAWPSERPGEQRQQPQVDRSCWFQSSAGWLGNYKSRCDTLPGLNAKIWGTLWIETCGWIVNIFGKCDKMIKTSTKRKNQWPFALTGHGTDSWNWITVSFRANEWPSSSMSWSRAQWMQFAMQCKNGSPLPSLPCDTCLNGQS